MDIHIIKKEIKEFDVRGRYYLELTLSEDVDYLWQKSFEEARTSEMFTSMRSSGAPVITNLEFEGDKIITKSFSEYAQVDLPEFIKELEHFIEIANKIYNSKQIRIQQRENQEERERLERIKKLEEMNKKLNS